MGELQDAVDRWLAAEAAGEQPGPVGRRLSHARDLLRTTPTSVVRPPAVVDEPVTPPPGALVRVDLAAPRQDDPASTDAGVSPVRALLWQLLPAGWTVVDQLRDELWASARTCQHVPEAVEVPGLRVVPLLRLADGDAWLLVVDAVPVAGPVRVRHVQLDAPLGRFDRSAPTGAGRSRAVDVAETHRTAVTDSAALEVQNGWRARFWDVVVLPCGPPPGHPLLGWCGDDGYRELPVEAYGGPGG